MLSTDVPPSRRFLQCACAIIWCLFSGGPIFGFAALKPILLREHIYESLCDISSSGSSASWIDTFTSGNLSALANTSDSSIAAKCPAQDLKLNMIFTISAMLTNVSAILIGFCLDNLGPRFCGLIGAFFLYLACFLFIFSEAVSSRWLFIDPFVCGYASMSLGGPFVFISSFQLSNSFPSSSGTILAMITGAFDASSALFLVFSIIYNSTNGFFSIRSFFGLYLIVPTFITLAQLIIMPHDSYKAVPRKISIQNAEASVSSPSRAQETDSLITRTECTSEILFIRGSTADAIKQPFFDADGQYLAANSDGIYGILHGYSAKFQLKTPWFWLICLFATVQMLRLNYFVATIGTQYSYLLRSLTSGAVLNKVFDYALPLGGIIAIPFIGILLDYCKVVSVFGILLSISLAMGLLGLIPNFYTGLSNIFLFVMFRPFFYTAISDYSAKIFGFDTFGTVYGCMICFAGVINYFQSSLDEATHTFFEMNPTPINSIMVIFTFFIGYSTFLFLKKQSAIYRD